MVNLRNFNPGTISDQAAGVYPLFPDPTQSAALPGPDDLVAWAKVHKAYEKQVAPLSKRLVKPLGATVDEITLGPIKALEVTPKNWQESDRRIVYVHGGAYTMMSASSTLGSAAMVADVTGQKVLSLDYTVAPKARWEQALDEVKQAFRAIHDLGFPMEKLGAFGDSAGGGMIAGAVLKMRDEVMGMPAALVLLSPWADITETGESYHTLKDAEPVYLYETALGPSALAYAPLEDQKHPYVSPVYGAFTDGYPPTLIQGGTREIFLSNFVRLYQAIDQAGGDAKLDLYEGMPHVFQGTMLAAGAPEAQIALNKIGSFFQQHLGLG